MGVLCYHSAMNTLVDHYKLFAQQLATEAGKELRRAYQAQSSVNTTKRFSPKRLKLIEDRTLDDWITQRIKAQYPEHAILSEESGLHTGTHSSYVWIIDPIDGSVNFSTHNPFVAISIALMIDNELMIGVIEAPLLNEQFLAVRGQGASVNGQAIQVSTTRELQEAYVVSCDGGVEDRIEAFSTMVRNYYDQVKDFRKLGSAALECAWVASGRADAYITMAIDPWDVAAGILLIQEAGGKVTTFEGKSWQPKQLDIICSNDILHEQLTSRLWG